MAEGEKKKTSMGLIIGLIVVGLLLASGVSYFVATKLLADNGAAAAKREPGVIMRLGDPKEGLIVNESITPYATNKLAIIVPADNPAGISGLSNLAKEGVKIIPWQ